MTRQPRDRAGRFGPVAKSESGVTLVPPIGLSLDELARESARFGVSDDQVRRDHAISHVLSALSRDRADDVIFFGGTALSRTHMVHARLSEDIDLIAQGPRGEVASRLTQSIEFGLLRTHGRATWNPPFSANSDVQPAALEIPDGITIKVQLLDGRFYSRWPVERREMEQRYTDAGPAILTVPTLESFSGWKTAAWHDRGAPRDLYDLWLLAERGAITAEAAKLFARHGTTGGPPRDFMFSKPPLETAWQVQLAEQTRLEVSAADALAVVRHAWASAQNENWD